jgi:hypothetical protein
MLKIFVYISLSTAALLLLCPVGACSRAEYHLQSEQWVRQQFENHKADYVRLVAVLRKDPSATHIGNDGKVYMDGVHSRFVPEYRDLIRKIGAQFVSVREGGSMEFPLSGFGCAICSDSYIGVRYVPKEQKNVSHPGWKQTVVASLESAKLPQENGSVASGLYVVPIEPEWFTYRFEYQE